MLMEVGNYKNGETDDADEVDDYDKDYYYHTHSHSHAPTRQVLYSPEKEVF